VQTPVGDAWIRSRDEPALRAGPGPVAPARLLPSGDAFWLLQGADAATTIQPWRPLSLPSATPSRPKPHPSRFPVSRARSSFAGTPDQPSRRYRSTVNDLVMVALELLPA
jgi:hypothetical protein